MAGGQIAFKYVALQLGTETSLPMAATRLPFSPWFWATGAIYGLSMVYWIWLLSRVPVVIAYPFSSLSLVILPLLSWFVYGELLTPRYWVGISLVMSGILVLAT